MDYGYQKIFSKAIKEILNDPKLDKEKIIKSLDKLPDVIVDTTKSSAKLIFKDIEKDLFKTLYYNRLIRDEFIVHQDQKRGEALAYFEALYYICIECGNEFCKYIVENNKLRDKPYTFHSLMHLHARMCTICGEIFCLVRNGYADGAYARWRSLDELKTILFFISEYGENVAESYYRYMDFEDYKDIRSSNKDNLHSKYYSSKRYSELKKSSYEWARKASCFSNDKKRITYSRIFKITDFYEKLHKQYNLACKTIHSSPSATFRRLSSTGKANEPIIAGSTDCGLIAPSDNTIISIVQGTICFIMIEPTIDSLISAQVLLLLLDKTHGIFDKAENKYYDSLKNVENRKNENEK